MSQNHNHREFSPGDDLKRFSRQIMFAGLGIEGQRRLTQGSALIIGQGGLGSWAAEFLVRAGVGRIRIGDADTVELTNIHRQAFYTEHDAAQKRLKVEAAAERLRAINSQCRIEAFAERIDRLTLQRAADGMSIILDGTDNFETRFLINDFAVKYSRPWVFAGVIGGEGQVMSIIPGQTPCLRCVIPELPVCGGENDCRQVGVIGPAVALISAAQAVEAIKILSGNSDKINPRLTKFDLWNNRYCAIDIAKARPDSPCPCCQQRDFIFLEP